MVAKPSPSRVHVLLFDPGSEQEGIHSIELAGRTVVLLFEDGDDAERYAGLLEAQDFPMPTVESLDREEMELFCAQAGYEARLVPAGFLPSNDEERLLIAPPQGNLDVSHWKETAAAAGGDKALNARSEDDPLVSSDPTLEAFRRSLEGLL